MAAAEDTRLLTQHLDDLLDHLTLVDLVGILIGQVRVLSTEEPNTQHDSRHARTVVRPRRPTLARTSHAEPERKVESATDEAAKEDMPHRVENSSPASIPTWALQRATDELPGVKDAEVIAQRAQEIAREGREREDERHDEYDDPDQGGEA